MLAENSFRIRKERTLDLNEITNQNQSSVSLSLLNEVVRQRCHMLAYQKRRSIKTNADENVQVSNVKQDLSFHLSDV